MPVRKLVDLDVLETSGVDHPAHMSEGWLVLKSDGDLDGAADELRRMAGTTHETEPTMADDDIAKLSPEAQAVIGERDTKIADLTKQVEDLTEAVAKAAEQNDDGDPPDGLPDEVVKALPDNVRAAIEKARTDAEEATKAATTATEELRKEREQAADRAAVEKARAWTNIGVDPAEVGPMLRKAAATDADLGTKLESMLSALSAQVSTGDLFKQFGSDGGSESDNPAEDEIMSKARELVTAGTAGSLPEAVAAVAKAHPDLYKRSRAENGA